MCKPCQTAIGVSRFAKENIELLLLDSNGNSSLKETSTQLFRQKWHLLVIGIAVVCLGVYFQFLNQTLYLKKAPFFDSVRYYDRLFEVVSIRQQQGLIPAIENATQTSSTFCLPYLLAIPFSYFLEPSRSIGVWIEVFYLAIFVFSFAAYLRRNAQASSLQIVLCMAPVVLMNSLYRSTAGMSDLRVDLPLAFLYGATVCWWLVGRRHSRWRYFVLAGICVGLACLTRATAPVFFIFGFVPLLLYEALKSDSRSKLASQFLVVASLSFAIAGWFFIVHFKFIYFYYAVWNTDANATVSIARSLKHVVAVMKSVGITAGLFFVLTYLLTRNKDIAVDESSQPKASGASTARQDLGKISWLALAPVLFLILKRTDINPFVSLPSAICLTMVLVVASKDRISLLAREYRVLFSSGCSALIILAGVIGYMDHTRNQSDSVSSHQRVVQAMELNARHLGRSQVVYSVNLLSSVNTASLEGTFQFSPKAKYIDSETVQIGNVKYSVSHDLLNPSKANWDRLPGNSIQEKINLLESRVAGKVDYIVAPTYESIQRIQAKYSYSYSSRFARPILNRFRGSGNWKPVSKVIDVEPGLKVQVFRNVSSERMAFHANSRSLY